MTPKGNTRRRFAITVAAVAALAAGGASIAVPAGAAPTPVPEGIVYGADADGVIKDSYIVMLSQDAGIQAGTSKGKNLVNEYGGEVRRTYTKALNGYAADLTETEAKRLAADPAVDKVVQNKTLSITAEQFSPPSWGLDRIDQPNLPLDDRYVYPDSAGSGVTAYIIDTGVRISHADFGGRASYGYDAVDNDNIAEDGNGHGTHVAGTVAGTESGVAKQAGIVAVRVLNDQGSGTTAGVVAGIDWVTNNARQPAVANMSLGGGADIALDTAVRNSIASGITYAVAAGNSNSDAEAFSPARVTQALTVAASTDTDSRAGFSNYGSVVDLFAPGQNITSAWNTGDTATNTISGTSMASPHVAGAAAVYLSGHPAAGPAQVAQALTSSAVTGQISDPFGTPNRLLQIVG